MPIIVRNVGLKARQCSRCPRVEGVNWLILAADGFQPICDVCVAAQSKGQAAEERRYMDRIARKEERRGRLSD